MSALKKNAKRLGTLFLTATVIGSNTDWTSVKAESQHNQLDNKIIEANTDIVQSNVPLNDEDLPSNDELFKGYLEQLFYGTPTSTYSLGLGESDLSKLNENEKKIYAVLKDFITKVANGEEERAELYLYPEDTTINDAECKKNIDLTGITFSKEFSWEDGDGEDARTQASKELREEINQKIDGSKIVRTLLLDCPYELYWFAKTEGYIASPTISSSWSPSSKKGTTTAQYIRFSFTVDKNYAKADSEYLIDNEKIQRAKNAKVNADAIVAKYVDSDDYDKLYGYLTEICDLNVYNTEAASSSPKDIGIDPWQLVYVFDGDTNTNVVCEGYSKAFAYLCEKSNFQNDVRCYIVTGDLAGGTGSGGHMWNIVTMEDGKNYIVDVTNCDGNSIGNPDKLFLAGLPGSVAQGYKFILNENNQASFIYDDETKSLYPESVLTLASENYTQKATATISNNNYSISYTYGDTISEPTKENFTTTNTDSDAVWNFQWYEGDQSNGNLSSLSPLDYTPKNAGTYTLIIRVTSTNFTPAEVRIPVTIDAKSITLNIQNANRKYGEPNPEFKCELAEGETLVDGDELSDLGVELITDATEDSNPGEYYIAAEVSTTNTNYKITVNKGTLTINKKDAISLKEEQRSYSYITGSGKDAVTINVASKLPEDIGEATYKVAVEGSDSSIINSPLVSADGKLTYKVPASTDNTAVGKKAIIIVTVNSNHYEDLSYKVNVELTDKIQIKSKKPVTLANDTLVYGDKLSSLSFNDVEFVEEETGNKVEGTLAFKEPNSIPKVGTISADWIFTPTSNAYDTVSGSVSIVVNRKPIIISNEKYIDNYTYTGNPISTPKEEDFTINGDLSNPTFSFDWYDSKNTLMKEVPSSIGEYILRVTVAESKNYSEGILEVPISIKNYICVDASLDSEFKGSNNWYHGDVSIVPPAGHLISIDKKTWESKLVVSEDHTGNFSYYLKEEKNDYLSDEKQIAINLDTIAPTGSISVRDKVWNTFLGSTSFGFYTNTEEIFTIKAEDTVSGMEKGKIEYLITDISYTGEDGLKKLSQLPESDWTLYSANSKIKQNTVNIIYVRLTDQAGNVTYLSTDKIWQDSIQPEIVLSAEGTKYTDSIGNNAYDGSVIYTANVKGEDAPLKSFSYSLDGAAAVDLKDGEKITIDTPGIHVLKITAEDSAGNQSDVIETVHVYTDFSFSLDGTSSVYDGQPIEAGTDFNAVASVPIDKISFSYSVLGSEDKIKGLPVNAGDYFIYAEIPEDTERCYKPQNATMKYTIEPKTIVPLDQTLFITKNLATDYKFDVSNMIADVTGNTIYKIVSVSGSGIIADTPKLEGSILTVPVEAVDSEEQKATIEISFSNPNYRIENAILTLAPTDKTVVQLTGVIMPETGVYKGEKFAYIGTPVWTTEDGEKVEVSDITILYESTDGAGYSSSEAPVNVGSYKVTISIDNADPKYIGTVSATFSITKKTVTVKVKDKTIFVGDSIPSLTELKKDTDYSIDGLISNDDSVGTLDFSYTDKNEKEVVPSNTAAGTYFIVASGLENPNYEFVYTTGKLVIESKQNSSDDIGSGSGSSSGGSNSGGSSLGSGGSVSGGSSSPSIGGSGSSTIPSTDSNTTPPSTSTDKTETKPDGTVIKTEEQTAIDGTKIKTVIETAPDGTVIKEYVTETSTDGSAIATTRETITNSLGTSVSKVIVENITTNGNIIQITEESSFSFDNAKTVVTTVKDSSGVTEASAYVSKQGEITATGKTKLTISNSLTDQIIEAAGTRNVDIVVSVTDSIDRQLYSLTVNKKKLESGNSLYLYGYNAKTDTYTMVNAVEYKIKDNQDLTIKASAGRDYTLLNEAEMNHISKQIMKTVKLSTSRKTKKSGKAFKVALSKKANKASIKKIVYTTSNKKIATVTKNGQVKTKANGVVKVKAKVTMKNGKTKTLVMKVKVKK